MTQQNKGLSHGRRNLLLFLFCLCCLRLVLNAVVPLLDPSEARYALICQIMAESGNYLEPKLIHEGTLMNFEGKPPLCFQMGALSFRLFGGNLFAVRLPSFLFAVGLLFIVYAAIRRTRNERSALWAAVFTSCSVVYFLYAGLCMTDMALTFCVCSAICFYMLFDYETGLIPKKGTPISAVFDEKQGNPNPENVRIPGVPPRSSILRMKLASIGFFASLALGMLVKGLVAMILAGLPVFFFVMLGKRWSSLRYHAWICGSLVFLGIAAPWYVLMQRANPEFLYYFFVNENFKRFLFKEYGDQYGAGREFFRGVSVVWFFVSNLPAILLLLFFLKKKVREQMAAKSALRILFKQDLSFLGVVCIIAFWGCTSRVLITYLLPAVPLFSIWVAAQMDEYGLFDREQVIRTLHAALPAFAVLFCVSFVLLRVVGSPRVLAMPGDFYQQVLKNPMVMEKKQVYFYRRIPYSAYFYLGDYVVRHASEDVKESDKKAEPYLMIARKRDLKKYPLMKGRKCLMENAVWGLYDVPDEYTRSGKE